jgi:DNA-binding MarR family transcriptional regulator
MANNSLLTQNPGVSSAPSLSPSLQISYNLLNNDLQRLFIKVFRYLWGVVSVRRVGVMSSYWAVNHFRALCSLSVSELTVLSYIYQMSNRGANFMRTDNIYINVLPDLKRTAKMNIISLMVRRGYINRSRRNDLSIHLQASHDNRPIFVKLSPAGIQLIEGIEKDINRLLMRSTLEELTGISNKKPG